MICDKEDLDSTLACIPDYLDSMWLVAPQVLFSMYFFDKMIDRLLSWSRDPNDVSQYMQGMWELKSIVVLSNAQPFERGLPIYFQVCEIIFLCTIKVREIPFYVPSSTWKNHTILKMQCRKKMTSPMLKDNGTHY